MNSVQLRQIIQELLATDERLSEVFGLGNSVYVFDNEGTEFEVVVRTAMPERTSGRHKTQDGPVAQE